MGKIHAARIDHSPRLQRVLEVLKQGPRTTREIINAADVCAVNSCIDELRENGYAISCEMITQGRFMYRLEGKV